MGHTGRIITVLVSTAMFALFGLLIGHLVIQASMVSGEGRIAIDHFVLLVSYGGAPLAGGILGFIVANATFMLVNKDEPGTDVERVANTKSD